LKSPHSLLFILGFFYYLLVPLFLSHDHPYHNIKFVNYLFIFSYLLFYLFCNFLFINKKKKFFYNQNFVYKNTNISVLLILILVFINLIFLYNVKSSLFDGYKGGNHTIVGPLVTLLIIITYYLIYNLRIHKFSFFSVLLSFVLLFNFIFIFSMGSRLYVLSSFIALVISYKFKNKLRHYIIFFFIITIFTCSSLYIGNWRSGIAYDNFWLVIKYGFFSEALLSSYSFHSFFSEDYYNLFNLDYSLLSFFFSVIPSFLLTNKVDFLHTINNSYSSIYSPFGTINIFASLVGTFGYLGTYIFLFFKSLIFSYLYNNIICSIHIKVLYIMMCSLIPFIFFREHLFITLKLFFIIYIFSLLIKFIHNRKIRF
jgi:hypothetical protein